MLSMKPFSVMIKPVCSTCNLDCAYCYYKTKAKELYDPRRALKMSGERLEDFTVQYLRAMPEMCAFNWQGGEPLLAGLDFFQQAVRLQKKHTLPNQLVKNNIQTNGTLLNEEWCRFFMENNFLVGISLDGPETLHNRFRRDAAGHGTFLAAMAGLELLRKNRVEFNVLVTLNSANTAKGREIYQFLVNRGVKYVQFIPILEREADGSIADFSCPPRDFENFLGEVFSCWKDNHVGRVSVRFIDDLLYQLVSGLPSICCNSRECANAFVLEWNGDLFACDHFVSKDWLIGNIGDHPLVELVHSPLVGKFAEFKTDLPSACRSCEYLQYCHGGCPKHHIPLGTDPGRVNYFCQAYKTFLAASLGELKHIAAAFRSENTEKIFSPGQGQPYPPERKIGRNDPCPCGSGRKYKLCCGNAAGFLPA